MLKSLVGFVIRLLLEESVKFFIGKKKMNNGGGRVSSDRSWEVRVLYLSLS